LQTRAFIFEPPNLPSTASIHLFGIVISFFCLLLCSSRSLVLIGENATSSELTAPLAPPLAEATLAAGFNHIGAGFIFPPESDSVSFLSAIDPNPS